MIQEGCTRLDATTADIKTAVDNVKTAVDAVDVDVQAVKTSVDAVTAAVNAADLDIDAGNALLTSILSQLNRQNGHLGQRFVDATEGADLVGSFGMIEVLADCTFTTLKDNNVNVLATWNVAAKTLPKGTRLFTATNAGITSVRISIGSIMCYNL